MKTIGRAILSAILLVLTGLMAAFAKFAPEQVFAFYPAFSRKILSAISSVSRLIPVALWEILLLLILLWAVYTLIAVFRRKISLLRWLSGVLLGVSIGVFVFVGIWGLNHFGPGVGQTLGLDVREYSTQELTEATEYYAAQVNSLADAVSRDGSDRAQLGTFQALAVQATDGFHPLAEKYDQFSGCLDPVKPLASWRLFSQFGNTGIFVCLTGESCVNPDTYEAWIPFTMCHEIAHRQAVAAEDEANFCAYLACMENDAAEFRYSGAFAAYIYCHNALMKADQTAAGRIWQEMNPAVITDIRAANSHYAQYDGKLQDAAQSINDAYLKLFDETSGVQSYGEVTDLLIAWYLKDGES